MGMFLTSDSLAKLKISKQMEFSLFTLAKEYNARYSEKGTHDRCLCHIVVIKVSPLFQWPLIYKRCFSW